MLLQALEIQGKHSESVGELSKICLIHRIFPPNEYSVRALISYQVQEFFAIQSHVFTKTDSLIY